MMRNILVVCFVTIASVGCVRPIRSETSDAEKIAGAVRALGGTVDIFGDFDPKISRRPKALKGKIGAIYLERVDLRTANLGSLMPLDSLELVSFRGSTIDEAQLAPLKNCSRLETLQLQSTPITDGGLVMLVAPKLKELHLDRCNVTDEGLKSLYDCKMLDTITLIDTHVTNEGISKLQQQVPQLKTVLWSTVPTEEVRLALAELERHGAGVVASSQLTLAQFANDQPARYSISVGEKWKGAEAQELQRWLARIANTARTEVRLDEPAPTIEKAAAGLPRLHRLLVTEKAQWTNEDLKEISNCVEIHELYLEAPLCTDSAFEHIVKIRGLTQLTLKNVPVSTAAIDHLANAKTLTDLTVSGQAISDSWLSDVNRITSLKHIHVIRSNTPNVSDAGIEVARSLGLKVTTDRQPK